MDVFDNFIFEMAGRTVPKGGGPPRKKKRRGGGGETGGRFYNGGYLNGNAG